MIYRRLKQLAETGRCLPGYCRTVRLLARFEMSIKIARRLSSRFMGDKAAGVSSVHIVIYKRCSTLSGAAAEAIIEQR